MDNLEDTWNKVEAELADAVARPSTVVELPPRLPIAVQVSGSVGGAAVSTKQRLAQRARDVHRARIASGIPESPIEK
jgi:hypothetical protein